MYLTELEEAGLTPPQAKTYLELLYRPGQGAGKLARQLSFDRSFTYGILDALIKKGLVSYSISEKKRIFSPADPKHLLKEIDEKRERISFLVEKISTIKEQVSQEVSVDIFEGKDGFRTFVRDILDSAEFSTFGGGESLDILELLKYDYPHYLREFEKNNIRGRIITSHENEKIVKELYRGKNVHVASFKKLNRGVHFILFKDKLVIQSAKDKPFAIVIQHSGIARALKDYFDAFWKNIYDK